MQLIIRLLSDLCTCSGDTHNSLVDTDVVYDENGILIFRQKNKGVYSKWPRKWWNLVLQMQKCMKYLEKKDNKIQLFLFRMLT